MKRRVILWTVMIVGGIWIGTHLPGIWEISHDVMHSVEPGHHEEAIPVDDAKSKEFRNRMLEVGIPALAMVMVAFFGRRKKE